MYFLEIEHAWSAGSAEGEAGEISRLVVRWSFIQ